MRNIKRWNVGLWGLLLVLCAHPVIFAEPMGSPSRFLKKGQWTLGLDTDTLFERQLNGAKISIFEGGHFRGYGLTNWLTLYAKVGGAYVSLKDNNGTNSYGGNLVLSGQLKGKVWESPRKSWQLDSSVGYAFLGAPHRRTSNQATWSEWLFATSLAKSLGRVTPYVGVEVSVAKVNFNLRRSRRNPTALLPQSGNYHAKEIVGPLVGMDIYLGGERDTVVNVETSYIGGPEIELAVTKQF